MDRTVRLMLAFLALLGGVAAVPAQARMTPADSAEIERVDSIARGGSTVTTSAPAEARAPTPSDTRERQRPRPRPSSVVVLIPSLQYGDRLLE
jgi:hypothetical protein